jgi:hypothetical protein
VVLGVLLAARGDQSDSAPAPGIWVAVLQRPADALVTRSRVSTVRIFDVVSGTERVVGPPAIYASVAFSPAGDRVAAIEVRGADDEQPAADVRIWTLAGDPVASVSFGGLTGSPAALGWSPDGTRLAAVAPGRVAVLDSEGRQLGDVERTTPARSISVPRGRPTDYWSPDSRYVAAYANGLVVIADRDGTGREFDLPAPLLGRPPESRGANFAGWKSSDRVALVSVGDAGGEEWIGVVRSSSVLEWGDAAPFDLSSATTDRQTLDQLRALVPGSEVAARQPTAERSADVFALRERTDPDGLVEPVTLAIRMGAEFVLVDIGASGYPAGVRLRFDVVIVPGWPGSPPARFEAATPLAIPTPRNP